MNVLKGHLSFVGPILVLSLSFEQYPSVVKNAIYNVRLYIIGFGLIILRDEETLKTDLI